ncbi:hypothetical protein [Pseudobdellovibrio sp. HCB154]|uniref:hypothetical protein n=1 Tax=Pseudobdellovibrio sp. HCB154 TaxID=3386277 RepID=UPI003916DB1D
MNNTPEASLKKPLGVYAMAILFILAPLGNILISFLGSGLANWYEPPIFMALLKTISIFDWIWLGLLILTGVLLFIQHKLSWTVAIMSLVVVLGINAFRLFQADPNSIEPNFLKIFSILAVVTTLGVLVIAFYFKFPYIDRRTKWTSTEHNPDRRTEERDSERRKK